MIICDDFLLRGIVGVRSTLVSRQTQTRAKTGTERKSSSIRTTASLSELNHSLELRTSV